MTHHSLISLQCVCVFIRVRKRTWASWFMSTQSVSNAQIYAGPCQLSKVTYALQMYIYSSPCVYTYRGVQPIAPAARQCLPDVHPSYGSPHWQVNSPLSVRDSDHHSFSRPALAIDRDLTRKSRTNNTHEPLYVIRHIQGHTHTYTHTCAAHAPIHWFTHTSADTYPPPKTLPSLSSDVNRIKFCLLTRGI